MRLQEHFPLEEIPLGYFPQHPADCFVNEVMVIAQEWLPDAATVVNRSAGSIGIGDNPSEITESPS